MLVTQKATIILRLGTRLAPISYQWDNCALHDAGGDSGNDDDGGDDCGDDDDSDDDGGNDDGDDEDGNADAIVGAKSK